MSRDNGRGTWRTVRLLERSVPQVKWYRLELVFMSLFVNVFALGLPVFILQVYDRVLPNLGLTTMQFLVIGLVAVMLFDFLLKTIRAAVTTYTGARFEHLARVSAVDHILRTPQDIYERDTPGAYLDKVNAIGVVKDFYSSQLGTLMIDLPFALFFLAMIWILGGVMVLVPLVLLALFGLMAVIVGGGLRKAVDLRSQTDNRRYDFLIEIMNGIQSVKAQAFKNLLQRRFESMQEQSARAVRSVAMKSGIAQSLGSTFGQLNMACVIGTGAILVINGNLSAGELAACTLLSGRAMQPLQAAMGLWTNFQTIRVACNNALAVLELPAEDLSNMPEMPEIKGNIDFRHVTFGYDGMAAPLIKGLDLNIKAGEMIGIEGENSSGRSTLLKLMVGLIRPTAGAVLIDGHDIARHKSESYRKQMAFLTADADVYSGTILDNLTYFRGGKYIRKAIKIAKELGLDDEIKRLPEGYGTHVGDGAGGVLPAGFVQRITIIRAMVDDPKIVLFDNANHGLDSNTDRVLLDYINRLRGKSTVILVSARPSWLRIADRRYVMADGDLRPKPESEETPKLEKPREALPAPAQQPMPEAARSAPAPAPATVAPAPKPAQQAAPAAAPQAPARKPVQQQAAPAAAPQAPAPRPTSRPTPAATPASAATAARPPSAPAVATPTAKPAPVATPRPKQSAAPMATPRPKQAPAPQQTTSAPQPKPAAAAATPQPAPAPAAARRAAAPAAEPAAPRPAPSTPPKPAPTAAAPIPQPAPRPAQVAAQRSAAPLPKTERVAAPQPRQTTPAPTAAAAPQQPQAPQTAAAPARTSAVAPAAKPKPAATLRAAPAAGQPRKNAAVLKPTAPSARRLSPATTGSGGGA